MVKYTDMIKNYLLKFIKKQRHKNMFMYTVLVSWTKSEQVFLCCNQLNCFNGTDLSWELRVARKWFQYFSFLFVIFKVLSSDFKVFLSPISMMFFNTVFEHVRLVISSIVVFHAFMCATCSFTDVIIFTCCYRTVHMIYQVAMVFKICCVFDVKLGTYFLSGVRYL